MSNNTYFLIVLYFFNFSSSFFPQQGCCGLFFWHKPTKFAHSYFIFSCVYFCLYGPFSCISFHKFSQKLSTFSLCSSSLISASLVLATLSLYESLPQPWYNPLWLTAHNAPTNSLFQQKQNVDKPSVSTENTKPVSWSLKLKYTKT